MIEFIVLGCPVGKGRPKFSTYNGHAIAYTPTKTTNYENLVKLSYMQAYPKEKPFEKDIALKVDIELYFPIPKSTSMRKRQQMLNGNIRYTKKADVDNCLKIILDALNKIAFYDDAQVVDARVQKFYSDAPRAKIIIQEVDE